MSLLKAVKNLFVVEKDYAGRPVETMLTRLKQRYGGDWSYLAEEKVYADTHSTKRIYPHELTRD